MLGNLNAKMFQEEHAIILGAVEGTIMENETQTRPPSVELVESAPEVNWTRCRMAKEVVQCI